MKASDLCERTNSIMKTEERNIRSDLMWRRLQKGMLQKNPKILNVHNHPQIVRLRHNYVKSSFIREAANGNIITQEELHRFGALHTKPNYTRLFMC